MQGTQNDGNQLTVIQAMKAAQQRGKEHPDYDAVTYYGDLLWTRVKSQAQFGEKETETFKLGPDIEEDRQEVKHKVRDRLDWGKELFNPNTFSGAQPPLKIDDHKLTESKLMQFAKVTTALRATIKARADNLRTDCEAEHDGSEEEHKDHQSVSYRAFIKKNERDQQLYSLVGHESGTMPSHRKPLRKRQLTAKTVQSIVHAVNSELLSHREVASKFNVKPMLVH